MKAWREGLQRSSPVKVLTEAVPTRNNFGFHSFPLASSSFFVSVEGPSLREAFEPFFTSYHGCFLSSDLKLEGARSSSRTCVPLPLEVSRSFRLTAIKVVFIKKQAPQQDICGEEPAPNMPNIVSSDLPAAQPAVSSFEATRVRFFSS